MPKTDIEARARFLAETLEPEPKPGGVYYERIEYSEGGLWYRGDSYFDPNRWKPAVERLDGNFAFAVIDGLRREARSHCGNSTETLVWREFIKRLAEICAKPGQSETGWIGLDSMMWEFSIHAVIIAASDALGYQGKEASDAD